MMFPNSLIISGFSILSKINVFTDGDFLLEDSTDFKTSNYFSPSGE